MKSKKEFADKYYKNVEGISKALNVDTFVATDMLIFTIKHISDQGADFYPGVGVINLDEAVKDFRDLQGSWVQGRE